LAALLIADAALMAVPVEPPSEKLTGPMLTLLFVLLDPDVLLLFERLVFLTSRSITWISGFKAAFCASVTVTVLDPAVPVMYPMEVPASELTVSM
jgi:hypothetical protein